jgi:hypothetical protein
VGRVADWQLFTVGKERQREDHRNRASVPILSITATSRQAQRNYGTLFDRMRKKRLIGINATAATASEPREPMTTFGWRAPACVAI